jgi:hypothetical protein
VTERDLVNRCMLVDPPTALSARDYAEAGAELEERLAELPGVISVYAIGGVSSLGVSDLDRIAVADAPVTVDIWERLSPKTRQVAMHGPFLVDRATFRRHLWFAHFENLRLVRGEAVDVQRPTESTMLARLLAVEGLVLGLLKIQKQVGTGRLKVRSLLCLLHSFRYSLELSGVPRAENSEAWGVVEAADRLRGNWFSLPPAERAEGIRDVTAISFTALATALGTIPPPPTTPPPATGRIEVPAPWNAFTLLRNGAPGGTEVSLPRPTPWPLNRIRRLTEVHWRIRHRVLALPSSAFDWLMLGQGTSGSQPVAARSPTVRAYKQYLNASSGHWSAIGFAPSFAI